VCVVLNKSVQFLNARDDAVSQTANIAAAFVAARKQDARNTARWQVARETTVSPARIKALLQPSRRPKTVDVGFFGRLTRAYLDYLRRRVGELETEIERVQTLARAHDRAAHALLDKA